MVLCNLWFFLCVLCVSLRLCVTLGFLCALGDLGILLQILNRQSSPLCNLCRTYAVAVEARVFMSWRAAVGGEAIPQMMGETASAVYDRLAAT